MATFEVTVLGITRVGNPVLKSPTNKIENPKSPEIQQLAKDMIATLQTTSGVGLAGPQVGKSLKIFVYKVPKAEDLPEYRRDPELPEGVPMTVVINPSLEPLDSAQEESWEGCLSIPNLMGKVPRYTRIKVTYEDLEGNTISKVIQYFHARIFQHETDHLNGILYPERMPNIQWGKNLGDADTIKKFVINPEV